MGKVKRYLSLKEFNRMNNINKNEFLNNESELTKLQGHFIQQFSHNIEQASQAKQPQSNQNSLIEYKQNPHSLKSASKKEVLMVVKQSGRALEFVSPELQADAEVVMTAVQEDGLAIQFADPALQADEAIMAQVIASVLPNYISMVKFYNIPDTLKANRQFMAAAVSNNGMKLQCASPELRADRELVLTAVENNGLALHYASAPLRADREVVLAAVKNHAEAIQYADIMLQEDEEIVIEMIHSIIEKYPYRV